MVTFTEMELTEAEFNLLLATRCLEYGTLEYIELPEQTRLGVMLEVSCQEGRLIDAIREGHHNIRRIQVHQGEPAYMETDFHHNGFSGTRRFKFN